MPKWTDYTTKTNPADNDEVMVLDTAGKANKRLGLSVLSDWILNKIADKVFQKLETNNKTVLGAINELNSKSWNLTSDVTKIPQNADMNTYQTPGNYIGEYNDLTTTLINCPVNEAFSLKIYAPTTGGYIIQEYTTFNGTRRILRSYSPYSKIWKCNEIAFK